MPWCPRCKTEYIEGITVCADCGEKLVDSLEESSEQAFLFESEEVLLEENPDRELFTDETMTGDTDEDNDQTETYVESENTNTTEEKSGSYVGTYRNSAEIADENRSSAYILLIIGALGLTAVLLILTGVIPLYQGASVAKYLVCGVMGAMFFLFIIFGIISIKNFRILSVKAKSEDSLVEEITKWCEMNLQAQKIDASYDIYDKQSDKLTEEQKYFLRTDKMKQLIKEKFMNLDEAFLEHFIDDYYQRLFEEI